jgi:hypothetical protein
LKAHVRCQFEKKPAVSAFDQPRWRAISVNMQGLPGWPYHRLAVQRRAASLWRRRRWCLSRHDNRQFRHLTNIATAHLAQSFCHLTEYDTDDAAANYIT